MWNTCLIGRRWKPREGWSRPVLTGDGDIAAHSPSCVWGWVRVFFCCWIVPGDNERWNGHEYDVDERFVSRPLAGSRTAAARAGGGAWVVFFGRSGSLFWGSGPSVVVFAVAMAQV